MKYKDLKIGMRVRVVKTIRGLNEQTLGELGVVAQTRILGIGFPHPILFWLHFDGPYGSGEITKEIATVLEPASGIERAILRLR